MNNKNIIRKTAEEYMLDHDGQVIVDSAAAVYRAEFRGLTYYAVDTLNSDEVAASIDPAKAIQKAMRLARVGSAGKVALDVAVTGGKAVGSAALQAANLAVSVVGVAVKLAGTATGGLASIVQGETFKAGAAVAANVSPVVKPEKFQKTLAITEYEAVLSVYGDTNVRIAGPFGEALVERLSNCHGDLFIVVGPSEIERCRVVGDAVDVALSMTGLSIGGQLRETGRSLAASGASVAGQAGRLTGGILGGLATGLLKASDAMNKSKRF